MRTKIFVALFLFLLVSTCSVFPQAKSDTFDIVQKSFFYPHKYEKWKVRTSLGFSMVRLPYDWVENAIQAPLINLHLTFGMPAGFSLESSFMSIIVSNQLNLGLRWNYRHKDFSFNLGGDIGYNMGVMTFLGFDNKITGWTVYPNLSLGYKVKNVLLTLKGEAVIVTRSTMKSGQNIIESDRNYFNGVTVGFYIEQRLWRNKSFIIGLKDNRVKYYWPAWMVFSTFDLYYHVPELYFSWSL